MPQDTTRKPRIAASIETTDAPKPSTPTTPASTTPGVRYVTITIPVLVEFPGTPEQRENVGGSGYLDVRLGGEAARGLQRLVQALQCMSEASRERVPKDAIPAWKREVTGADAARYLFALVERSLG